VNPTTLDIVARGVLTGALLIVAALVVTALLLTLLSEFKR
jgi:hypothetical protein